LVDCRKMSRRTHRVWIGLGGNVGDRAKMLREALHAVHELDRTRVVTASHLYETEPWGVSDQPLFLNAAAEIETELAPLELLNAVKGIEWRLGREPSVRWGPRRIDIDIILWDGIVVDEPELRVPHPAFRERAFVLTPLAEIAGAQRDPETERTIADLAQDPSEAGVMRRLERLET